MDSLDLHIEPDGASALDCRQQYTTMLWDVSQALRMYVPPGSRRTRPHTLLLLTQLVPVRCLQARGRGRTHSSRPTHPQRNM